MPDGAQPLAGRVEQLRREGAFADPRRVGLDDRDDPVDPVRRHPAAGACAAGGRVGGGDEGVRAVVDVQQRRLAALEQDGSPLVERLVEQQSGVRDVRKQPVGRGQQRVRDLVDLDRTTVVDLHQQVVLLVQRPLDLLSQDLLVEEVLHPDPDAVDLVGVSRADAAPGRADLPLAQEALRHLVHGAVVGGDDVRVGRDEQPRAVDPALGEAVDLLEENLGVDDDAVGDHRDDAGAEDARGQQVEGVLLLADHHRVAGVVAAVELDDVVHAGAERVGGLALALVAPLGSDEDDPRHPVAPSVIEPVASPAGRQ